MFYISAQDLDDLITSTDYLVQMIESATTLLSIDNTDQPILKNWRKEGLNFY